MIPTHFPELKIEIVTQDAAYRVAINTYDDQGNATGLNPTYHEECKALEGKVHHLGFAEAVLQIDAAVSFRTKHSLKVMGPVIDPQNEQEVRASLWEVCKMLTKAYIDKVVPETQPVPRVPLVPVPEK